MSAEARTDWWSNAQNVPDIPMSPQLGSLLTEITAVSDPRTALWKILDEYLELKCNDLEKRIADFEARWDMPFEEFSQKFADGTLAQDTYSYEMEKNFWEWEQVVTLQHHYQSLRLQ
ncbi:MAG: hypothetical protein U9R15_03160 [Chloroflexota bacterium]|nr:hypothetical protein [Chloroflexota bacterium]